MQRKGLRQSLRIPEQTIAIDLDRSLHGVREDAWLQLKGGELNDFIAFREFSCSCPAKFLRSLASRRRTSQVLNARHGGQKSAEHRQSRRHGHQDFGDLRSYEMLVDDSLDWH